MVPWLGQNCGEHHLGINSSNVLECGVGPNLVKTNGTLVSKGMKTNATVGYANAFTCGLKIRVSTWPLEAKLATNRKTDVTNNIFPSVSGH